MNEIIYKLLKVFVNIATLKIFKQQDTMLFFESNTHINYKTSSLTV